MRKGDKDVRPGKRPLSSQTGTKSTGEGEQKLGGIGGGALRGRKKGEGGDRTSKGNNRG